MEYPISEEVLTTDERFKTLVHRLILIQQKHRLSNSLEISEEIVNALLSVGVRIVAKSQSFVVDDEWEIYKEIG